MSQVVSLVEDVAEISVTIILAYVAYKIAVLVDALTNQIKTQKTKNGKWMHNDFKPILR